jgi:TRAP-type C4-dicarboxylate transport system substrate-binding protein
VNVLVNLDAWKSLNDAQRKVLSDAALWLEALDAENVAAIATEREKQTKAGIAAIDFGPAESKTFIDRANDVAWQAVIAKSPDIGKKLRELAGN